MKPPINVKQRELNVCGWPAVSALFARHPGEVRRLFFDAATGKRAGELCSQLAQQKKVYRQVDGAELEKIAGSKLHGGIVAVIGERPMQKVTREVLAAWAARRAPLLLLDRVGNANNLGAIARTAAFFGVNAIVVPDHPAQALPGEAAYRVAEGGMEFVEFFRVPALPPFCAELKARYFLIGTSLRGNQLSPAAAAETLSDSTESSPGIFTSRSHWAATSGAMPFSSLPRISAGGRGRPRSRAAVGESWLPRRLAPRRKWCRFSSAQMPGSDGTR